MKRDLELSNIFETYIDTISIDVLKENVDNINSIIDSFDNPGKLSTSIKKSTLIKVDDPEHNIFNILDGYIQL